MRAGSLAFAGLVAVAVTAGLADERRGAASVAPAGTATPTPTSTPTVIPLGPPTGFTTTGSATFGPVGDARRDLVVRGFALDSAKPTGAVTATVTGLDPKLGRWYRLSIRGLPQANFAVADDDLYLKVAFFGAGGKTAYDAKELRIYDQVESARRDLGVNGVRGRGGAEVWRTYRLDVRLPFPEIDTLKLTVGFGHGGAAGGGGTAPDGRGGQSAFLVDEMTLTRLPDPPDAPATPATPAAARPRAVVPAGELLPLGGRWYYAAAAGESTPPKRFDADNVDRLLYKDAGLSAPFAGNVSAVLRAGFKDAAGTVVVADRPLRDNVTLEFTTDALVVHTKGIPNHPTGRFPEAGRGNPSYVGERLSTYYLPLEPKDNPARRVTDEHNANGALHMGPIGLAVNGVVFFNPFDMGNQDATDMMDRCCGHPNPMSQYHYHKYPVCVNTPWDDDGAGHSPVIGWAFDGYPVYGPYESAGVMAKDAAGDRALDAFNAHYDAERGWHYHVTPGKFPYLIGGFRGVEDARDARRGPPGGGREPGGREQGGPGMGGRGPGGPRGPGGRDGPGGPRGPGQP